MKTRILLLTILSIFATNAFAWDGDVTGTVVEYNLVVGNAGNYDLRILLTGLPVMCSNGPNWAYVNTSEANYNATLAAVMIAKTTNSKIRFLATKDTAGYCHIGWVVVAS